MGVSRRKLISTAELIKTGKLKIGDGYRAKNSELSETGLPFARAGNIDSGFNFENADRYPEENITKVGEKVSQAGDVVFTSKGTVGRFAFVRENTPRFVYSPQLCYWRSLDQETVDSRWLYFWMQGPEFRQQVAGLKGQTDMADYVSLSDQRRMAITLPDPNEQRAIAAVLGALDDKIEHNRRTAQKLEELARAIFRAWFVDFEPVKAKAAGARSFPSMPQPVFDALPTRFTYTELGPVPEGWEMKKATDLAMVAIGKTPPRKEPHWFSLDKEDIPWVSIKDMGQSGVFINSTSEYIIREAVNKCRVRLIPDKSVLFSFKLTIGRVAIADGEIASNEAIAHFVPNDTNGMGTEYLYCYLSQYDHSRLGSTSSIATATNSKTVKAMPIIAAPSQIAEAFTVLVRPQFDLIKQIEHSSQKLTQMRDYLLPKLLSGEVRLPVGQTGVRQAERMAEAAL